MATFQHPVNPSGDLFDDTATVSGAVERVTFHSADSGFCVLRVLPRGARETVTVVGNLADVNEGEHVEATGRWVDDKRWGRQLRADTLRTAPPAGVEGMRRYLASGLIKGIGPGLADKLVDAFGDQVFDVISHEPRRLREVDGIGPGRSRQITEAWAEQQQVRDIMVFLQGHGLGTQRAFRIYKQYGDDSIGRITQDPYCLARDIRGIGFALADQLAGRLNLAPDAPQRVAAGCEHVLRELTGAGHCAYATAAVRQQVVELLGVDEALVDQALNDGVQAGRLVRLTAAVGTGPEDADPEAEDLIALAELQRAEAELARTLRELADGPPPLPPERIDAAVAWAEAQSGLELAPAQRAAVALALSHKVTVITGGPGVGKTTLVNAILRVHEARKQKIVACAPTGRAAKRLAESTGCPARTIHRLLEFIPATGGFRHDRSHPLAGQVFVVDEFSMVDVTLAWQLVRALPPSAVLLIVGDADQLPSVGPGQVLADIIASGAVPVARLDVVFRQERRSLIVHNAHRINRGLMPETAPAGSSGGPGSPDGAPEDFYFIERDDPEDIAALVVDLVARRLPRRLNLDPVADTQVLTPMKRGPLGTIALNQRLQEALNPRGAGLTRNGLVWRIGDKVMQVVNDYDKDVFNGDWGTLAAFDATDGGLTVDFDGRRVAYDARELDELMHAYAVSVHKSQGSEYPVVVLPLHTQHYALLQRNLLYTAVTRGRRLVVLVGSQKAVRLAVNRVDQRHRVTTLRRRLADAAD